MSYIDLESVGSRDYVGRRVAKIREVLLANVALFEDAGWAFDASRFAVWLESTVGLVSTDRDVADFYHVVKVNERDPGSFNFADDESIVAVALTLVEDEHDAFEGEYDSEADFAEKLYASSGYVSEDFPVYFAIDWQKVWDCSLRFDFDSACVLDVDGVVKRYFWRNV